MPPFVIFALPRSRTFWLSKFLTAGGWVCEHDEARHVRGMDDVRSALGREFTGYVETGAAPFWPLIRSTTSTVACHSSSMRAVIFFANARSNTRSA